MSQSFQAQTGHAAPRDCSAEQMWLLADTLAKSGTFRGWREVEQELIVRHYHRAPVLLDTSTIRSRLDFLCTDAPVAALTRPKAR